MDPLHAFIPTASFIWNIQNIQNKGYRTGVCVFRIGAIVPEHFEECHQHINAKGKWSGTFQFFIHVADDHTEY